ncbi:MAG: zinc-ribbon domain-containing protein, partial [Lachnospiraceae bacterium]|nr:zinc-ribbon domain-containing protein [Lachnospiraceae bacterium]
MRFCTNCGKPLTDDAVFCTNCGQKAMTPKSAPAGPGTPGVVPPVQNGPAPLPNGPAPVPPTVSRPNPVPPAPNRPGYVPPAGPAPMNPLPPKKDNEPKQKKSPLVPILIVS